jgi:RNA polymerase sigma-70 factor (family 1)
MSALTPYDEKALLAQMAAGDGDAFGSLFRAYEEPIRVFVQRFVKSPQLAEDLSQEVFLKIWQQRERLAGLQSFRAFLFIVARNHTINTLRSASHSQVAMGEISRHALPPSNATEDRVLLRDYMDYLQQQIAKLPPRAREVFRLCREQQLSYDEVARELGISRHSVKSHMVLSMKLLKASVERDLGIPLGLFLLILHGY